MRRLTILASAAAAALAAGSAALAFTPSPHLGMSDGLTEVSGGCGPGWHLTANGLCRRNVVPYAHPPYAYAAPPYPGACWWTSTPFGARRVCAW